MSIRYEQVNLEEKVAMLQSDDMDLEPFYEPKKESKCPSGLLDSIPIVITFLIAIIVVIAIVVIVLFPPITMQLEKNIATIFSKYENKSNPNTPGCSVGIYDKGKIVFSSAYGHSNIDYLIKNNPNTIFDIGSISKQFTAASIAILIMQKKLKSTDLIIQYIPELPSTFSNITVYQIVHHTSGIKDYFKLVNLTCFAYDVCLDNNYIVSLVKNTSLDFVPGLTLDKFFSTYIFSPLKMTKSFLFKDYTKIIPNRATGYAYGPLTNWQSLITEYYVTVTGDGSIRTNVLDFSHWINNFRDYAIPVGSKDEYFQLTVSPGVYNNGTVFDLQQGLFPNASYAYGIYIENVNFFGVKGLTKSYFHGGSMAGFKGAMNYFPEIDVGMVLFCNDYFADPKSFMKDLITVYFNSTNRHIMPFI